MKFFSWLKTIGVQLLIVAVLLALIDWLMVRFDILTPPYRYGDPELGFFSRGPFLTSAKLGLNASFPPTTARRIAMVGDSHSALPLPNRLDSHEFVLERTLRKRGIPAVVISAGHGKYSPLQEYLLYQHRLRTQYSPDVLLLNFYAGNDFYDMLRPDDRPHYVRNPDGSVHLAPPVWFAFRDPSSVAWREKSRLLWAIDEAFVRQGFPRPVQRITMLYAATEPFGATFQDTLAYLKEVRASVEPRLEYSGGFSAQILNQALFFHHFPTARQESLAFIQRLLRSAQEANPDVLLVMSAIPSAALAAAIPRDISPLWEGTISRVGLTKDQVRSTETELYSALHELAEANGWLFIDLLPALRRYQGRDELYSSDDLHLTAAACEIIGNEQARQLLPFLSAGEPDSADTQDNAIRPTPTDTANPRSHVSP